MDFLSISGNFVFGKLLEEKLSMTSRFFWFQLLILQKYHHLHFQRDAIYIKFPELFALLQNEYPSCFNFLKFPAIHAFFK